MRFNFFKRGEDRLQLQLKLKGSADENDAEPQ